MSKKILLIEDEAGIRSDILEILSLEGYKVYEAENGGTGLGFLETVVVDLIICDIAMPDFDGYQVLEYVRKQERLAQIPFIFLTAQVDRSFMRHGMELGADDYLTKPFTRSELLAAIETRLARYQVLSEIAGDELEKAKKRLTNLVAHELRTPLVSVTMVEQLISSQIENLSKEQLKDLLSSLKSGSHRLHHLVEQMVLMTQIDSGVINEEGIQQKRHSTSLSSLIEAALESARQFAYRNAQGKILLETRVMPQTILCHSQSLRHAIAELIANALDFSPEGTTVIIGQRRQEHFAWLSITDDGPGLTTARLQRALMPFEQIDREKREQQGMGLGLPLAKKIINLHKGEILFRNTASGGTQVIIQLPLYEDKKA